MDNIENLSGGGSVTQHTEGNFDERKKKTELILIISLFSLIIGVIFLSFNLRLLSGCFVIAGASVMLISIRKYSSLLVSLKNSLDEALSLNEKKEDVIADFSHRIREPLNNQVIISNLLAETPLQKKQKELMDTFVASINNMVTTVNELTMKSAVSLHYSERNPIRFNIISTIQNTIDLYKLKEKTSLDIIFNKKDLNETLIEGDPIILKQIFLDIFNSVEAQNSDRVTRVTLNISRESKPEKEDMISFRIQTDNNRLLISQDGTSGLMASKLISLCRGKYDQSSGNNCTILIIKLPFAYPVQRDRQTEKAIDQETEVASLTGRDLGKMNVLLVEDDLINQKITLLTLKPLVNRLETASNGREAIEKFVSSKFDLILMDIQMPVMDGLDTAEKIREIESGTGNHIPIIAITANAMLGDMEKCLAAGIDDYISKPYKPADLLEKINLVIQGSVN
jgi:CheY-like chemotaxis protein